MIHQKLFNGEQFTFSVFKIKGNYLTYSSKDMDLSTKCEKLDYKERDTLRGKRHTTKSQESQDLEFFASKNPSFKQ